MNNYSFYVVDTETTGLEFHLHDIIEISFLRISTGEQKTWHLKPLSPENISLDALRINGHKLEDLLHQTKEGRERYLDPHKVIVEIENWVLDDDVPAANRFLIGHNCSFDKNMMENLWKKCNSVSSFPFGRRLLDTMILELFFDFCKNDFAEGYSLANLVKKYAVKNEKAHTAEADTKATKEVFLSQVNYFKKLLEKSA